MRCRDVIFFFFLLTNKLNIILKYDNKFTMHFELAIVLTVLNNDSISYIIRIYMMVRESLVVEFPQVDARLSVSRMIKENMKH